MCGPELCSMKITHEVRDFAAKQNQNPEDFSPSPPTPFGLSLSKGRPSLPPPIKRVGLRQAQAERKRRLPKPA